MTKYWIEQRGGMYFLYYGDSPASLWCSDSLDRVQIFREVHSETGSVLEAKKAVLREVGK